MKSRYNTKHYRTSDEELAYVTEPAGVLRGIVREACEARLAELRGIKGSATGSSEPLAWF